MAFVVGWAPTRKRDRFPIPRRASPQVQIPPPCAMVLREGWRKNTPYHRQTEAAGHRMSTQAVAWSRVDPQGGTKLQALLLRQRCTACQHRLLRGAECCLKGEQKPCPPLLKSAGASSGGEGADCKRQSRRMMMEAGVRKASRQHSTVLCRTAHFCSLVHCLICRLECAGLGTGKAHVPRSPLPSHLHHTTRFSSIDLQFS